MNHFAIAATIQTRNGQHEGQAARSSQKFKGKFSMALQKAMFFSSIHRFGNWHHCFKVSAPPSQLWISPIKELWQGAFSVCSIRARTYMLQKNKTRNNIPLEMS